MQEFCGDGKAWLQSRSCEREWVCRETDVHMWSMRQGSRSPTGHSLVEEVEPRHLGKSKGNSTFKQFQQVSRLP